MKKINWSQLSKKQKRLFLAGGVCALLIIAIVTVVVVRHYNKGRQGVDDYAASRTQEEEGDIHYIDEGAIALAGQMGTPGLLQAAAEVLGHVNAIRANNGLGSLAWSDGLAQAALGRAVECESLFSHTRPNGSAWWTVNSALMYGENLAWNYYDSSSVIQGWMNSPTHAANILGNFRTLGVAAYVTDGGAWYWAQEFGY